MVTVTKISMEFLQVMTVTITLKSSWAAFYKGTYRIMTKLMNTILINHIFINVSILWF